MLGHADIQTTQIYAKMVDEAISEDMQKMRSKFDKMEDAVTPLKENRLTLLGNHRKTWASEEESSLRNDRMKGDNRA